MRSWKETVKCYLLFCLKSATGLEYYYFSLNWLRISKKKKKHWKINSFCRILKLDLSLLSSKMLIFHIIIEQ